MTMHLDNRLSGLRTSKPRGIKMTRAKREQIERDLRLKNKALRQRGEPQWTFDQYVDWLTGRTPKHQSDSSSTYSWQPSSSPRRGAEQTARVPSRKSDVSGACALPEPKRYTGSLVKGISVLHKSNAVPVISDEEITDISRMRR